MLRKCLTLTALTTILGACSLQDPAPVISGFDLPWERKYREVKPLEPTGQMAEQATSQAIEPAAGPESQAQPQSVPQTYTPPAIRVSELPGNNQQNADAQKATPTMQTYMVQQGDTLFSIASKYQTNVSEIMAANSLSNGYVQPGTVLMLPSADQQNKAQQAVAQADTNSSGRYSLTRSRNYEATSEASTQNKKSQPTQQAAATQQSIETIQPAAGSVKTKPAQQKQTSYQVHTLEAGQTLYRLSRLYDVSVEAIRQANLGIEANNMNVGQQVRIPTDKKLQSSSIEPAAGPVKTTDQQTKTYKMHTIRAGETLYRLSREYGTTVGSIQRANPDVQVNGLRIGQQIRVPVNGDVAQKSSSAPKTTASSTRAEKKIIASAARASGLAWPVNGKIINKFGSGGSGITHTGLNIAVPENTPVAAAEAGTVIYADDGLKSYGNLVLIRHDNGLVTAYAHNSSLTVKKNETVEKGQVIAYSGKSGNVTQPQVHFEVRRNAQAIDPMEMLSKL